MPACRAAGLELASATTDNGPEFGRPSARRVSRPASASIESRRAALTSMPSPRRSTPTSKPSSALRFYNFERPHRGYRTKGRTPASIFFSGRPEILHQMGA